MYDLTFKMFIDDRSDYWVLLLGFSFGIGAMCGQFFVALFELSTYYVLAFSHVVAIMFITKCTLPQTNGEEV